MLAGSDSLVEHIIYLVGQSVNNVHHIIKRKKYSATSIIRTSFIRNLDYPD